MSKIENSRTDGNVISIYGEKPSKIQFYPQYYKSLDGAVLIKRIDCIIVLIHSLWF